MHGWLALHIIAFVCWFAGLFYLPRLFVYHAMTEEAACKEQFKVMEYKLYYYIMMPSIYTVILSGAALLTSYFEAGLLPIWLQLKLVFAALLIIFHTRCGRHLRCFAKDENPYSHRYFRFFNEVPTVALVAMVCLAVFKQPL